VTNLATGWLAPEPGYRGSNQYRE